MVCRHCLLITIIYFLIVVSIGAFAISNIPIDSQDIQELPIYNYLTADKGNFVIDAEELTVPKVIYEKADRIEDKPHATSTRSPALGIATSYYYTNFYENSPATIEVFVENRADTPIFVYSYGVELSDEKFKGQETGHTIEPGEKEKIGFICIDIPANVDSMDVKLGFGILARTSSNQWYDYGLQFLEEISLEVMPIVNETTIEYVSNEEPLFTITNDKVDPRSEDVRALAASGAMVYPGEYNIYQVCSLFEHVKNEIKYMSDPRGEDYWATPDETLKVYAGDCDDSAILLSSLIEAIGGSTRMYFTDTHAFTTVYIGKDEEARDNIDAVKKYNGCVPVYYTTDEYGSWLILDTTSGLYAGDLPAGAMPTDDAWVFTNTETVNIIDIIPD
ncbi:transglutaminase family protein [Methanococcoides sp. NM1]|uniref:transglutaminase-like domain-containing protein n=1 Tax=Methanococcoides sp. NM1 TaxID=1201013 RepID=UPI00108391D5|nr:transglutaminase family protein [Methanococcoides sp. NM1]